MYHELTTSMVKKRRRRALVAVLSTCILALFLVLMLMNIRTRTLEQGAAAMRDSIVRTARQCCATEGSYPSSLEYLENHYGLTVNRDDYVITYETFADNVPPSVVVVPR